MRDEDKRTEILALLIEYGIYTLSRTHRDNLADRYLDIWTETDLKSIKESFALVAAYCQQYSPDKVQGFLAKILIDPARCAEVVIDINLHNSGHYVTSKHIGPEIVYGEAIRKGNMENLKKLNDEWDREQRAKASGEIQPAIKIKMPWQK